MHALALHSQLLVTFLNNSRLNLFHLLWGGDRHDNVLSSPSPPSLSCSFFHLGETNLVVAGADMLRVFQLVPDLTDIVRSASTSLDST